jgi:uncharacterized membrane protein (UPF0127 family)
MTAQRIQLFIFCILLPIGVFSWYLHHKDLTLQEFIYPVPRMRVGDLSLSVELAKTAAEREQGLSGRDSLTTDGLLFIFPKSGYPGIWMKNMRFPIDIIWIGADLKIVHIEENVSPESYPKIFRSSVPALYVLETNARFVDTFGIAVGQEVTLPPHVIDN